MTENVTSNLQLDLQIADWRSLKQDAKYIRTLVFIEEQHIPEQEEWDDQDQVSQHFVIYHDG